MAFAVALLVFVVVLALMAKQLWQRRRMPITLSISQNELVLLSPKAIRTWRQSFPLASITDARVSSAGPTLQATNRAWWSLPRYRLEKSGTLILHLRNGHVRLLHGTALDDLNIIAIEIRKRINPLSSPAIAT